MKLLIISFLSAAVAFQVACTDGKLDTKRANDNITKQIVGDKKSEGGQNGEYYSNIDKDRYSKEVAGKKGVYATIPMNLSQSYGFNMLVMDELPNKQNPFYKGLRDGHVQLALRQKSTSSIRLHYYGIDGEYLTVPANTTDVNFDGDQGQILAVWNLNSYQVYIQATLDAAGRVFGSIYHYKNGASNVLGSIDTHICNITDDETMIWNVGSCSDQ